MKRFFRLSAALAALALLSGCASLLHPRLVEDLQLIQTIGFDGVIGDMTVSVSSGEASEDAVSAQLAARGASIQTAVQRLQDFSPREELFLRTSGTPPWARTARAAALRPSSITLSAARRRS